MTQIIPYIRGFQFKPCRNLIRHSAHCRHYDL